MPVDAAPAPTRPRPRRCLFESQRLSLSDQLDTAWPLRKDYCSPKAWHARIDWKSLKWPLLSSATGQSPSCLATFPLLLVPVFPSWVRLPSGVFAAADLRPDLVSHDPLGQRVRDYRPTVAILEQAAVDAKPAKAHSIGFFETHLQDGSAAVWEQECWCWRDVVK